jgi:hypothetical protein
MLSYNSKAQEIVAKISEILQSEHIPVWLDERVDMKENNMYDRYVLQTMTSLCIPSLSYSVV